MLTTLLRFGGSAPTVVTIAFRAQETLTLSKPTRTLSLTPDTRTLSLSQPVRTITIEK